MKKYYLITTFAVALAGCSPPGLEFKTEPLTGQEFCVANSKLLPLKIAEGGVLSLKYEKAAVAGQSPIKATLNVSHKGRKYHINPDETLKLLVDGNAYTLDVVNSFQQPQEVINNHSAYTASGKVLTYGIVKEVTTRQLSFYLSKEMISKIVGAKTARFELNAISNNNSSILEEYPILLQLTPENISLIRDFQQKCINSFINPSGENK